MCDDFLFGNLRNINEPNLNTITFYPKIFVKYILKLNQEGSLYLVFFVKIEELNLFRPFVISDAIGFPFSIFRIFWDHDNRLQGLKIPRHCLKLSICCFVDHFHHWSLFILKSRIRWDKIYIFQLDTGYTDYFHFLGRNSNNLISSLTVRHLKKTYYV